MNDGSCEGDASDSVTQSSSGCSRTQSSSGCSSRIEDKGDVMEQVPGCWDEDGDEDDDFGVHPSLRGAHQLILSLRSRLEHSSQLCHRVLSDLDSAATEMNSVRPSPRTGKSALDYLRLERDAAVERAEFLERELAIVQHALRETTDALACGADEGVSTPNDSRPSSALTHTRLLLHDIRTRCIEEVAKRIAAEKDLTAIKNAILQVVENSSARR